MTTRIAKLYVPVAAEALLLHQSMSVEADLLARFDGFTSTTSLGAWQNPRTGEVVRESVHVYEIAMNDDPATALDLFAVVKKILLHTHEDCVMYVTAAGDVQFIDRADVVPQQATK